MWLPPSWPILVLWLKLSLGFQIQRTNLLIPPPFIPLAPPLILLLQPHGILVILAEARERRTVSDQCARNPQHRPDTCFFYAEKSYQTLACPACKTITAQSYLEDPARWGMTRIELGRVVGLKQ